MNDKNAENDYIKIEGMRQPFLEIANQINRAFKEEFFVCTDILCRKLLESLIIDLLMKNPGPDVIWEDASSNVRHTLHHMLVEFWNLIDTSFKPFIPQYPKRAISELKDTSWEIKKLGDYRAHAVFKKSNKDNVLERRDSTQMLVDFILDLKHKIPENIKLPTTSVRKENIGLEWYYKAPTVFPTFSKLIDKGVQVSLFSFGIVFDATEEIIDCTVNVNSNSQAAVFRLENPVFKWERKGWRIKKVRHDVTTYVSDSCRLSHTGETEFQFPGIYRPVWLHPLQNEIILRYRIIGKILTERKQYDSGIQILRIQIE